MNRLFAFLAIFVIIFNNHHIYAQSKKNFDILSFDLELPISEYSDFSRVDTLPKNTISTPLSNLCYSHNSSKNLYILDEPLKFLLAITTKDKRIISINAVINYTPEIVPKLQDRYGHWQTGALGSLESDSVDVSKLSYYIWRLDYGMLSVAIQRYQTGPKFGNSSDYIIISYSK